MSKPNNSSLTYLEDLVIDRVDLVSAGANSAAWIELYKTRKEHGANMELNEILAKMKPEHRDVVQKAIDDAKAAAADNTGADATATAIADAVAKAMEDVNSELATLKTANADLEAKLEKAKKDGKEDTSKEGFDETEVLKGLSPEAATFVKGLQSKIAVAEAAIKKSAEDTANREAIAKAAKLKSLPVEQDKLVDVLKSATPEYVEILETVCKAIDETVLKEQGSSSESNAASEAAWSKIEKKAKELVKSNSELSFEKAIGQVIEDDEDLYKEYLEGGAN